MLAGIEQTKQNHQHRVEQHVIDHADPRFVVLHQVCWLSKNLYNVANYLLRQEFIFQRRYIPYKEMAKLMQQQVDYCALPRKVSQQVLKQLDQNWQSYFASAFDYREHPEKYRGRPHLPSYKNTKYGRNEVVYTRQALSTPALRKGIIQPSGLDIWVRTHQNPDTVKQVRIVPRGTHYVVEVVYTLEKKEESEEQEKEQQPKLDLQAIAGIDIGVNNLAAVTSNQAGFVPFLVNGRPLKAINQFYNQSRAHFQSQLPTDQGTSKRIQALTDKRNRRIKHYLHESSRRIVDRLVKAGIGQVVIGKNIGWKQNINLGKRNNQNFVMLPHARFIEMLTYKAQQAGIVVHLTEESYTSKCSFLDCELIQKHEEYAGKRRHRGLFYASNGRRINADVNGSYNIIRKVIPNAFSNGIAGVVIDPVVIHPTGYKPTNCGDGYIFPSNQKL